MCGPHHYLGRGAFAPDSAIVCLLLQRDQNASVVGQRRADLSPGSAGRKPKNVPHPRRTPSPLLQALGSRYTQVGADEKRDLAPIGSAKAVSLAPPDLSPSSRTHQPLRTMVPTCSPRSARSRSSGRSPLMIWNCFSWRALARRSIMTRSNGSVGRLRALRSDTVISLMNSALGLTFGSTS